MDDQQQAGANEAVNSDIEQAVKDLQATLVDRLAKREAAANERAKKIKEKTPSKTGAAVGFDFDIAWKDQKFLFGLPSATMKEQKWVITLPEIKMQDQTIILHLPSTRMKDVKIGQYPEFHGLFTIVWKDIIISVPEPYMQENKIILGLPSVTMKNQDVIVSLPEFALVQNEVILRLPEFTLKNTRVVADEMQRDAEHLQAETKAEISSDLKEIIGSGQQKIVTTIHEKFAEQRKVFNIQKDAALKMMDGLIQVLKDAAAKLNGADPGVIEANNRSLQEAVKQRSDAGEQFAIAEKGMDEQERLAIKHISEQLDFKPENQQVADLVSLQSKLRIVTIS